MPHTPSNKGHQRVERFMPLSHDPLPRVQPPRCETNRVSWCKGLPAKASQNPKPHLPGENAANDKVIGRFNLLCAEREQSLAGHADALVQLSNTCWGREAKERIYTCLAPLPSKSLWHQGLRTGRRTSSGRPSTLSIGRMERLVPQQSVCFRSEGEILQPLPQV
jgi:hypothetical protein